MNRAADQWVSEAQGTAARGDATGAVRTLEWLRDRVEGKALEKLEEARKRIGGEGE
jgi:hypothetical protein